MTRVWSAWERFWFQRSSVAPLVLVRIGFGVLVFFWALSVLPDAKTFFGPDGLFASSPHRTGGWSVLDLWNSNAAAVGLVVLMLIAALCLIVGVGSRLASLVIFVGFVSLGKRDPFVGNSGDGLLRALSLYVLLAPVGAAYSLDALRRGRKLLEFPQREVWALRLIQIQVSLIYLGTVWAKLRGTEWPGGTAVGYAFRLDDLARFPAPDIGASSPLTHLVTWAVVALELSLGILIWNRRLRPYVLIAGVCLHLGIEYRLRVGFFSWAILVSYLSFVAPETAERFLTRLARLPSRRWRASGSTP